MTVPTEITYSLDALVNCGAEILALIDGGTGVGKIRIYSAEDVLLVDLLLSDPGGYVNIITGGLELDPASGTQTAIENGEAAYAQVTDSDNTMVLELPAAEGAVAAPGYIVLNALSVVSGSVVTVLGADLA